MKKIGNLYSGRATPKNEPGEGKLSSRVQSSRWKLHLIAHLSETLTETEKKNVVFFFLRYLFLEEKKNTPNARQCFSLVEGLTMFCSAPVVRDF